MPQSTEELFSALNQMYNYFNEKLFENKLGDCIINCSRKKNAAGVFYPNRWSDTNGLKKHEISINPDYMTSYGTHEENVKEFCSTAVHEQCHQWQKEHGKKYPDRPYHNREWSDKMIQIGLMPSHTGAPKGKRTGVKMSHYIIEGGLFEKAFNELPKTIKFPFLGLPGGKKETFSSVVKYKCDSCNYTLRGKAGLTVICGKCTNDLIGYY